MIGSGPGTDGRPTNLSNPAITPDCAAIDINLKFLPQETKEQVRADFEAFVYHWAHQYSCYAHIRLRSTGISMVFTSHR